MEVLKVKHTPGPWKFEDIKDAPMGNGWWITDGKLIKIARLGVWGQKTDCATRKECVANAALIAAAPELLEGFKNVLERLATTPMQDDELAELCRSMIAKAEGK